MTDVPARETQHWRTEGGASSCDLADLGAAAEEIGRLRWRWDRFLSLAGDAPLLTNAELRARVAALATLVGAR